MDNKTLKEEIIKEIGNQSLKRLKIDIIKLASNETENINTNNITTKALISFGKYSIIEINNAINTQEVALIKRMSRILSLTLNDLSIYYSENLMNDIISVLDSVLSSFFSDIDYLLKNNIQISKIFMINIFKYIQGEISLDEAIFLTTKSIVTNIITNSTFILEKKIFANLSPITTPVIADILAKALSIIASAFAIVLSTRIIEQMLRILVLKISELNENQIKLQKIEALCNEFIPQLAKDREKLLQLHLNIISKQNELFNKSFEELKKSLKEENVNQIFKELTKINELYGIELEFKSFEEFDEFMKSNKSLNF